MYQNIWHGLWWESESSYHSGLLPDGSTKKQISNWLTKKGVIWPKKLKSTCFSPSRELPCGRHHSQWAFTKTRWLHLLHILHLFTLKSRGELFLLEIEENISFVLLILIKAHVHYQKKKNAIGTIQCLFGWILTSVEALLKCYLFSYSFLDHSIKEDQLLHNTYTSNYLTSLSKILVH